MRTLAAALAVFLWCHFLCAAAWAQDKSLTLYTSLAPTESGPLAQAFEKKTGIKVELWRAISEKVVQRAITESRARRFAFDVIETNAPEMEMMAREQLFAELDSPHLADLPPGAVPKHRMWIPDRMNFFVVAYNTTKVRREELPKDYLGFLDTGGYVESCAARYNAQLLPATVLVSGDRAEIITEREQLKDIAGRFRVPPRLLAASFAS